MPGLTGPSDYNEEPARHPHLVINTKAQALFFLRARSVFLRARGGVAGRLGPRVLQFTNRSGLESRLTVTRRSLKKTPQVHIYKADLLGLKKEEVKVEIEEYRILQISGKRSKEVEEKKDRWHRVERSQSKFLRRFHLLENAKVDQVKAEMENSVLTVTVPKEEVKKPEVMSIEISG